MCQFCLILSVSSFFVKFRYKPSTPYACARSVTKLHEDRRPRQDKTTKTRPPRQDQDKTKLRPRQDQDKTETKSKTRPR